MFGHALASKISKFCSNTTVHTLSASIIILKGLSLYNKLLFFNVLFLLLLNLDKHLSGSILPEFDYFPRLRDRFQINSIPRTFIHEFWALQVSALCLFSPSSTKSSELFEVPSKYDSHVLCQSTVK